MFQKVSRYSISRIIIHYSDSVFFCFSIWMLKNGRFQTRFVTQCDTRKPSLSSLKVTHSHSKSYSHSLAVRQYDCTEGFHQFMKCVRERERERKRERESVQVLSQCSIKVLSEFSRGFLSRFSQGSFKDPSKFSQSLTQRFPTWLSQSSFQTLEPGKLYTKLNNLNTTTPWVPI